MSEFFYPDLDDNADVRIGDFAQMLGMGVFGNKWQRKDLEAHYSRSRYSELRDMDDPGDRGEFIKTMILDALKSGAIRANVIYVPPESRSIAFNSFVENDEQNFHAEFARQFCDGPPPDLSFDEREDWLSENLSWLTNSKPASEDTFARADVSETHIKELREEILSSWEEFEEQYKPRLTLELDSVCFNSKDTSGIDWLRSTAIVFAEQSRPIEQPEMADKQSALRAKPDTLFIARPRTALNKLAKEPSKVRLGDWGNRYLKDINPDHLILIAAVWRIIAYTSPSGEYGDQKQILERLIENLDLSKGERPPGLSDERLKNIISEIYNQWKDRLQGADLLVNFGRPWPKSHKR